MSPSNKKLGISSSRGFILLIVLIYINLIALISVGTLMQIKQDLRLQNQIMRNERRLASARAFIRKLEQQVDRNCFNGCTRDGYEYRYQALGQDPCAIIGENQIADYYRVTLVSIPINLQDIKIIIQNTFIRGTKSSLKCEGDKHSVLVGEQSSKVI